MKYYTITFVAEEGFSYHFGEEMKISEEFPGMIELTKIVKKYYNKHAPTKVLINIDSVTVIYQAEETVLESIKGGKP